jgi:hypothetical protein
VRDTILVCYFILRICTVDGQFTSMNRQIMKRFNAHGELIKWRISVKFNCTSTQSETGAVNFETLFGETKYKTSYINKDLVGVHPWLGKKANIFINYPFTIRCTLVWERFRTSWLECVLLYSQKKRWLITAGIEIKISPFSFRYTPLGEAFFLRSATYTRNVKLQATVKTVIAGSVIKF